MASATSTSPQGWQSLIRQRLEERDAREKAFDEIVDNYQRLARHAKQLKDRNTSMLFASNSLTESPSVSTIKGVPSSADRAGAPANETTDNNAVRLAYVSSLETQLKTAKDELSILYKTQAQNAQRVISLNEQIRDKDERERETDDESRRLHDDLAKLKIKEGDLRSVVGEKDNMIQMLQDELSALSLELNQVEIRNDGLKRDNASLLQRWLDRMNDEAEKMNEGNRFLQEVEQRRGAKEDATPVSSSPPEAAAEE